MLKKLAPYTRGYGLYILLGVLCSVGESVLELELPQAMSEIVDVGIANGDRSYILLTGLKMFLMAMAALLCGVGAAALAAKAAMGFGANLRQAEYEQVQRFSFANIERFSTASLITRLTNDVSSVQMTMFMGMRMCVRAPVMLVTALIKAMQISLDLSQVFLVAVPLLILAVVIVIRYVGPFFTALQNATDDLNLVVQENLNAVRVVKSFVREEQEKAKFAQRSDRLRSMAERAFGFVVLFMPVMMILMGGTITAVLWIGGHYVWEGTLLSGDLIAFFTYVSEILMSLMMVSVVLMMLTRAIACGKRIVEVLEEEPRITDKDADPALTVEDGSIRFDHVYFKYHDTAESWNLEDVSFSVPSGATVGILGGTGSAKTTLVSMIPRLYDVNDGAVFVGGHNVKNYTMEALRDGCAMVLQKNTLFSGTIRENLRWGDEHATDQEIEDACRLARRTAQRSGWQERLLCQQGDLRLREDLPPMGRFDLVVSNPPYFPPKAGRVSPQETRGTARSEVVCTLEDVCRAAGWLLRWGGSFCLVHKPERLADLCCALRARGLEPKRLRLVCRRAGDAPSLLLLEARRGGRPGLDIAAPLCLEDGTGRPTAELDNAYFRTKETNA